MKTLQNNFTTPEQSKLLLELGVPADSADCYYSDRRSMIWVLGKFDRIDWEARVGNDLFYTPCWSVGRLIEIFELCYIDRLESHTWYNHKEKGNSVIERVLWDFDDKKDKLDFSKLED